MAEPRQKLIGLLDYIEQVVRLDERVAFCLSGYRLSDGSTFAVSRADTHNLPNVRHDLRDEEGPVWLEIERLARKEPPAPPKELGDWIILSPDPARRPEARPHRLVTVSATERDAALAKGEVRPEDILEAPRKRSEAENAPPKFDLKLRLEDRPEIAAGIEQWISGTWTSWSIEELPRRRTIALYQQLYKVFQLLEVGGPESAIELMWGIGIVHWHKEGVILDRPLLERRVEIELDDLRGGLIRVRPTSADALFDLKPYEELGCVNLPSLSDLLMREIKRAGEGGEGVSPFLRESYEAILSAAGSRLDPDGCYAPEVAGGSAPETANASRLTVTDRWVLFARPRSQHVILQDIDRLRRSAEDKRSDISGLPERLVTEPSRTASAGAWKPLSTRIGEIASDFEPGEVKAEFGDVFFPKPFNDDQLEIIQRLSGADGLVVQGPPGTGKTHTIANLICHAMATGQRVLVVSRGEAALAVLKEKLPKEVQPLAIAVLSNERQGLRQIESAIREIQSVVEGMPPANRHAAIARLEKEIQGLQKELRAIDDELDNIAEAHLTKMGPRAETPAALAQRIVSEREAYRWFTDQPTKFASETGILDGDMAGLSEARWRVADLIDHLDVQLPAPEDMPDANTVVRWHTDLIAAAEFGDAANVGPAHSLRITVETADSAGALALALKNLARVQGAAEEARWIDSIWRATVLGAQNPWCDRLRERISEAAEIDAERAALLRRSVDFPPGILDNQEARAAIDRAAIGQKLWALITLGKSEAKALVAAIKVDGAAVQDGDTEAWRHVAAVVANSMRQREANARWDALSIEIGAPAGENRKTVIGVFRNVLLICDDVRREAPLFASVVANAFSMESVCNDQSLCLALAEQIKAGAASVRLSAADQDRRRVLKLFRGNDRTSVRMRQLLADFVGKATATSEKVEEWWTAILYRLEELKTFARDFETIATVTHTIAESGAPVWAKRLAEATATPDDPMLPLAWRDAWDHSAAEALLSRIDKRERLVKLANDRANAERQCRKLFGELVRERTFYELNRRLSPSIKSALVEFVHALTKIGKGTGKTAWIHRLAARDAMSRCYDAVPCWIMPTWRVAEQLPAELGAIDLVIIDEASQSDVTELPALLRGKKILVVGDDRQVSPTAPFVTQEKIDQLRHHYLSELPFKTLFEPGASIYDLMRAVFPNERLMLKEHFRCVEPIIRFSMQFYPEKMLPLRIPAARERLDPPLIDIYVPHGARSKHKKINEAEADVIVAEIATLTARPEMRERTIGVISLIGAEQAEFIRARLSETIGEELMQRHAILCGDSATFQGTEREIVFLSMVADSRNKTALTMLRYEQRFNVAVSRARDRVVLVRSVKREELKEGDLKARLIAHFENPMPELEEPQDVLAACESGFERDLMRKLLERRYRVQPQVGSLNFRIDMVVEGADGARLAVECDGDRYHGPEQWRQDMRRQRVLERVGWRFWRCFASSFYRETDTVVRDLVDTLSRMGIEPVGLHDSTRPVRRYTEHRTAESPQAAKEMLRIDLGMTTPEPAQKAAADSVGTRGIDIGDKLVILFSDDSRRISVRLTNAANDLEKGQLSIAAPLGQAVLGADEGDEVDVQLSDGRLRKALIESVEKTVLILPSPNIPTSASASVSGRA